MANSRPSGTVLVRTGFVSSLVVLCLCLVPLSCDDTTEGPRTDNVTKTLSTVTQVDDYPLYVMRYYGDYRFDAYLKYGDRAGASSPRASSSRPTDTPSWSCTTFAALSDAGEYVLGRNFDWYNHMALLLYTDPPAGHASVTMVDLSYLDFTPGDNSESNLRKLLDAPYWPFDGMNERGVSVGMMAVPHGEGGDDPSKKTIGSLAAIRLMLDYAGDVDQAVSLLGQYNIDFSGGPPVHYLVSDSNGRSAVIEFIDNEMTVIPCDRPWQVATNFIITGSPFDDSPSPCWRYNTAYKMLQATDGVIDRDEAMGLLADVSQFMTMWSVVYSGDTGELSVAVGRKYDAAHRFTMHQLRFLR